MKILLEVLLPSPHFRRKKKNDAFPLPFLSIICETCFSVSL